MNKMKKTLLSICAMLLTLAIHAAEWKRLSAVIMTPWGEQIDPENVWQEYPRPQLVRQDWMNLNGVWEYFRRTNTVLMTYENRASRFNQRILVPFGVESALSGIMEKDLSSVANSTLMYRRTFTLTEAFKGKRTLLHFGAVDWRCTVFVNGEKVGEHDGGSDPFSFDITHYLKAEGEQELQVAVYDPSSRGGQPRGKQTTNPSGIWYTSCSGIWQTVWLEPVNDSYIERYEVVPDALASTVRIKVAAQGDPRCKFYVVARDGDKIVASSDKVPVDEEVTLEIPNAKLWSPDSPFLYDLDIYLCAENCQECDRAGGYFGMRTFSKGMVDGHPAFLLNGKPIFMYGPLDQGWWPDGLLTPPSYEAMIYDLQTIKALGMNMVRKHIKVENDLWYEWCDRNGLIVWQDMPSGSEGGNIGTKKEIQHNFYDECERIVTALKQHPCIGVWVPYNEGWGQDASAGAGHTTRGYLVVRNADADMGRLMNAASGWTDFGFGDITDAHSYPSPNGASNSANDRINVCGEFGGITLMIEGHLWAGSQQTYTQVEDSKAYTQRFNQYTAALQALQKTKGLWAGVYTQITDVEQEVNGILTYDRKVLKVNEQQLASLRSHIEDVIHRRMTGATSVVKAGDNATNIKWRYTTTEPETGWQLTDFDDSPWKQGAAGFGKISQPDARVRTNWSTDEIWLRRHFTFEGVTPENVKDLRLRLFYDEDSEVYINGVLAFSITGYNTTYQLFDITDEAREALQLNGDNVIAIHTKQTSGGQYIDAGFSICSFKDTDSLEVRSMTAQTAPQAVEDPERAYLLCYSKADDPQMFYAYSLDGITWQTMNQDHSIFAGSDGTLQVQSPFIARFTDEETGKDVFHLVHANADGNEGYYHWKSDDLLRWQPINGTDGLALTGSVFTPEIAYHPSTKYFVCYWTANNREALTLTQTHTKDFVDYTSVTPFFKPDFPARDLHIFMDGKTYVALFVNDTDQSLYAGTCGTIIANRGKFSNFRQLFSQNPCVTNPATFPALGEDGWFMVGMMDGLPCIYSAATAAPADLTFRLYTPFTLPRDMQGGKVLVISRAELAHLQQVLDGSFTPVRSPRYNRSSANIIYNLQGQRVTLPRHSGIYVTAGKKLIVDK